MTKSPPPSHSAFRALAQPPAVLDAAAEHWTSRRYLRRLSLPLTRRLVRTPITANQVSVLMIIAGALAGPALLLPGLWGPLLAVALTQVQMLLDCIDGEVARSRGTTSPAGVFLDQLGHFLAEGSIALFIGLRAAMLLQDSGADDVHVWMAVSGGALLLAGVWLNKALNQMVVVARALSGLPATVPAAAGLGEPSLTGRIRSLFRFFPVHRIFHSVDLTLVVLAASLITLTGVPGATVFRALLAALVAVIWVVVAGHTLAIWKSPKLRG